MSEMLEQKDRVEAGETHIITADQFLEKLKKALTQAGDFPSSARVVNELSDLAANPQTTAQQIAEVILKEPSLSTRILSLVNSSFYRRTKPIVTISQAVVALGMNGIAELCTGLVLIQRFAPLTSRGGAFASSLQKAIVTSLLSSTISAAIGGTSEGKKNELGYISGFFAEIGTLLLAYYFPKLYEAAVKRSALKNISLETSLWQIIGYTPRQLSIEVLKALELPNFFCEVLDSLEDGARIKEDSKNLEDQKIIIAARSVGAGYSLSTAIHSESPEALEEAIRAASENYGIEAKTISRIVDDLPTTYREYCNNTQIPLPTLPTFINQRKNDTALTQSQVIALDQKISQFIDEIRVSVANKEPTASVISAAMECLTFGLRFDRAILFLFDKDRKRLQGRMMIGKGAKQNTSTMVLQIKEDLNTSYLQALHNAAPVYNGVPLLEDGKSFVVIPIGNVHEGVGVLYADLISKDDAVEEHTKSAISVISGLLEKSLEYSK